LNRGGTGRAGVHHEAAAHVVRALPVRVAVDDDVGIRIDVAQLRRRRRAQPVAVHQHDAVSGDVQPDLLRCARPETAEVGVAQHGVHRCNGLQLDNDVVGADVAGVKDQVHARERVEHRRPQRTVRVADEADARGAARRHDTSPDCQRGPSPCSTSTCESTRPTTKSTRSSIRCGR
jgi:hypothetical protein